jgi:hypothetical protein
MTEVGTSLNILWDTLKLSAAPLRGRGGILVVAQVRVQKPGQRSTDAYRVSFELNRHHGLVSHDTEVLVSVTGEDSPRWRYSGQRDLVMALKDHFVTTQLYAHMAGQLGWIAELREPPTDVPLDP